MTWKIFIDMAASFWFFSSFLAKSISFYFRNQIYTALGFQKYSHCNKVLYISPWTIPFYTSDVSLLTKKSLIFAIFYTCESGVLLKYANTALRQLSWYRNSNCGGSFLMKSLVEVDFWKLHDCTGSYALYVTESAHALCRLHCQVNSTSEIFSKVFSSHQESNLGPPPIAGRYSSTELWLTSENIAFRSATS